MANTRFIQQPGDTGAHALSDMHFLLEAAGIGLWRYDGGSNTFTLDATCREIFDLDEGEDMNMENMRERIHPDDLELYWRAVEKSMESGELQVEYRVIRKDGTIRFVSGRGRSLPRPPGEPPQAMGVCIDVTDRHNMEERMRITEERMQHLADGVPGLFSYIDRDYRIQFMSSAYRDIFNRSQDELIGEHMGDVLGWEAFRERQHRYDAALAGETVRHDASRIMPGGEERHFVVTHVPHHCSAGHIHGVMTLAIDITDRRTMEEALKRKTGELARSNHDLEQFAYVASHDLKAPLRAIEVLVQWLREDLQGTDIGEVQENLGLLEQRSRRLNRLLDDLLDYSRAGRKVGRARQTDTRALVDDIATLLAPPEGLHIDADASLPVLHTHSAPLEQVLRNLINNAVKHHPRETGTIRVYAQEQDGAVMFAVEDDGAGIPAEYADKVFQMFQTLQPRDDREGSGMGLAIVKRIIDWQGGRIWFHPGPGDRGTVFKFIWNKLAAEAGDQPSEGSDNEAHTDPAGQHFIG